MNFVSFVFQCSIEDDTKCQTARFICQSNSKTKGKYQFKPPNPTINLLDLRSFRGLRENQLGPDVIKLAAYKASCKSFIQWNRDLNQCNLSCGGPSWERHLQYSGILNKRNDPTTCNSSNPFSIRTLNIKIRLLACHSMVKDATHPQSKDSRSPNHALNNALPLVGLTNNVKCPRWCLQVQNWWDWCCQLWSILAWIGIVHTCLNHLLSRGRQFYYDQSCLILILVVFWMKRRDRWTRSQSVIGWFSLFQMCTLVSNYIGWREPTSICTGSFMSQTYAGVSSWKDT